MANTYTCLLYHVTFSTKDREPCIARGDEGRIWAYMGGIARENGAAPVRIGGVEDHIHLILRIPPSVSVSDAVRAIKGGASRWIHEQFRHMAGFAWQDGYGAFTVSKSALPEVVTYIEHQREHHQKMTFQEEYRRFLEKHEIEYDERYLWG